jgi:ketosteroid isomerase-like protein
MSASPKRVSDESEIADVLAAYTAAIHAKDASAAAALYTRDVVAFDLAPPLRQQADEVRDPSHMQQWFDTWRGAIESRSRDLEIAVGGSIAYAFALQHMTGTKVDGEQVDLWFRTTACLRIEKGSWKIAHVHNSVPFAMDGSGRALLDLKP